MNSTRTRVLNCFKTLHQTRKVVFREDDVALTAGRLKINEEFRKNMNETDPEKVNELIKTGSDASELLKQMVVQAKLDEQKGVYEVRLRKETHMTENLPYDDSYIWVRGKLIPKDQIKEKK